MLTLLAALAATLPAPAAGEQASQPPSPEAGYIDIGNFHSCAVNSFALRCWGYGGDAVLGYGDRRSIGDDETPGSVGPVDFGPQRAVTAIAAGDVHTCALLDDGTVRCWGFGANGRLGYGSTQSIDTPAEAGPVFLGVGRTATAISAGGGHTCALLDDNSVRCWGVGGLGRLGYANLQCPPQGQGPCPADVGRGCAFVDNVCTASPNAPSPASMGPVDLGAGRTAKALTAGEGHTCVILDNDTVRCWGSGGGGRLGYGNNFNVGDNETPGAVGPVDLGSGRTAKAISAGREHTCAVLDDNSVRCWGSGGFGQLGYGSDASVGAAETPGSVGPVDLGAGRTAKAISAAGLHTCARLDDDSVRCWGYGANGRLGYCNEATIGDTESPGSVGPVALGQPGIPGAACAASSSAAPAGPSAAPQAVAADPLAVALAAQSARAADMRACLTTVRRKGRAELRRARRLPSSRRRSARRQARRRATRRRRACVRRHGRVPGRVTGLAAQAAAGRKIRLSFTAVGTDGSRPPAAHTYLVKQSRRPIRTRRDFARAPSLCKGRCSFKITRVGATLTLDVTGVRRRALYYFAVAARDNVSGRPGPRSNTTRARVR